MEDFDFERAEQEMGHVVSPGQRAMAGMYQDVIDHVQQTHSGRPADEIHTELVRVAHELGWEGDDGTWRQFADAISTGMKVQVWTDD
jgi:hypothetical protein